MRILFLCRCGPLETLFAPGDLLGIMSTPLVVFLCLIGLLVFGALVMKMAEIMGMDDQDASPSDQAWIMNHEPRDRT